MNLTKLPSPPSRDDPKEVFIQKMDDFVKSLPKCIDEIQEFLNEVQSSTSDSIANMQNMILETQALNQEVKKAEKNTKEYQLLASQGVCDVWKAGVFYSKGNTAYSPLNSRVYKAKVNISDNLDCSLSPSWAPALLHTGLFIEKAYAPREFQGSTHWLVLKEGVYSLPSNPTPNETLKITNLSSLPVELSTNNFMSLITTYIILPRETKEFQYEGAVYGWV